MNNGTDDYTGLCERCGEPMNSDERCLACDIEAAECNGCGGSGSWFDTEDGELGIRKKCPECRGTGKVTHEDTK